MDRLDFGDYCEIEQKRYGVDNELFKYKVIRQLRRNKYRSVPVDARNSAEQFGKLVDVVAAIRCGVVEEKVEYFRLKDVVKAKDGSFASN